ncbi:alpha/beta hydrolase [Candidatus Pelagibacter sp.]|jgi:pimeloyl-ACP methyl ester carboxylesterase|nr:alpha/beta hydrolase [Candidatus Pelagibacter sp.]|tara:strand:+ start:366 stop:1124 length:759 start_codon:yes stop_codon:yes gene_type:complete
MQDIFVEDIGGGTPFVLVHGFLGSSNMWSPQIDFFKNDFRVIAPALPGFGKSNKVNSCNSIECMAEAILISLEKKKIKNFNLLGHSMGGMIVQEIAKLAGDKILKLICYGTGPRGNIPGRFETIEQSREKLKIDGLEVTAHRIAKTWFIEENKSKYFYLCDEASKQTSMEATDNGLIAMKNWNGVENLKNIKNETLIIWGDQDKAYNFNQIKTLNDNISNSDLKIIKGCSHNVHLEKPEEFNLTVSEFLKIN